jgi:hypothetical protein
MADDLHTLVVGREAMACRFEVACNAGEFADDTDLAIEAIVEERRQLSRQRRIHTVLHAWLWVHVPMSAAMLVLIAVHIVVALRYSHPW